MKAVLNAAFPFLSCLIFLLLSGKLRAEVIQKESFNYYSVAPKSGQSLRAALKESSPLSKDNKVRFGGTEWSIYPQYRVRQLSNSCYIGQINVQLHITFTLPKLLATAKVSESTRKKFDFFYQALYQHELGHKKLGVEAANKIRTKLSQPVIFRNCQELATTINKEIADIIDEYMSLNHEYDLQTDYGRTQGAVISEVIIVE